MQIFGRHIRFYLIGLFLALFSFWCNPSQATTLGTTTVGTPHSWMANCSHGNTYTAIASFTAVGMYVYLEGVSGAHGKGAVYRTSAGLPTTLLQASTSITLGNDGWHYLPFGSLNLVAGETYFICIAVDTSYGIRLNPGVATAKHYCFLTGLTYPSSYSPTAFSEDATSMYLTDILPTQTITPTRTATPTSTGTRTVSPTYTITSTFTHTPSITPTRTVTFTPTASITPSITLTPTPTSTITPSASITPTFIPTATATITPFTTDPNLVIAYPVPAKGREAWFSFHLQGPGHVTIELYNVGGERVATLTDDYSTEGRKSKAWNIQAVAPGLYIYRVVIADTSGARTSPLKKMLVVK